MLKSSWERGLGHGPGGRLWIDGRLAVDNDFNALEHPVGTRRKYAHVHLAAGFHQLRVVRSVHFFSDFYSDFCNDFYSDFYRTSSWTSPTPASSYATAPQGRGGGIVTIITTLVHFLVSSQLKPRHVVSL